MNSETYADLGGVSARSTPLVVNGHRHRYDPLSGWCGCGTRDDGMLAEGSPAWHDARDGAAA
ncbi:MULTISPECIES: hypothetical protein [Microbacterium]|uniref:hypothetical protein n=1 Tax=Microbacterium TaxID=33882 RepID=UPI0027891B8D|nr:MULTISPECIES: hypothetical protein [Microbacterium]MDQ1084186.1 hypothetical protein [Microbacterium sp. SORGH_AS_0344]MDQ1170539.1 hypothetical protein [Microbacterium proteolyticum]